MAISGFCACIHAACTDSKRQGGTSLLYSSLPIIDLIVGIAAVVLGVLAYLHILPLPSSIGVDVFAYGTIVGGSVNILASALAALYSVRYCFNRACCSNDSYETPLAVNY